MNVSSMFSMKECKRKALPSLAALALAGACFFGSAQHARAGLPDAVQLYTGTFNGPYYAANMIVTMYYDPTLVYPYYTPGTYGPVWLYGVSPGYTTIWVLVQGSGGGYFWHPIQVRIH